MDSSDNRKKGKFFYDIVVIQVENTLHRIPRYHLETWSQTFKDMFQHPQGDNAEGSSDEHPIILPGCTNDEFESLLTVVLTAVTSPTLSKGQWISVLKLATMWVMAQFRELAIDKLSSLGLTPIEKAQLGNAYQVASWILDGCTALIQDAQSVSLDDYGASLGWEMATRILYAGMKLKPQGTLVMGSETWQCPQCSSSALDDTSIYLPAVISMEIEKNKGKFFYDIVVLEVDDTLHRIPRYHLESWSQMFKDMFQLPQGPESEGSSENNPIILSGCSNVEFESLLTVLFTPAALTILSLSKDEWISVLKLATMWDMGEVRKLAIKQLSSLDITPLEKVQLGRAYKIASWLIDGCTTLIEDPEVVSLESLASSLGWETAARIAWAARKNPTPRKGKISIGTEKWQCTNCSRSATITAVQESVFQFGAPASARPRIFANCSACSTRSSAIQVELSSLDFSSSGTARRASGSGSSTQAVKEVFADELKGMY